MLSVMITEVDLALSANFDQVGLKPQIEANSSCLQKID